MEGARVGGVWGYTDKPGTLSHWPGGLVLCFPQAKAAAGTLVMASGDINLTFKRYVETPVRLSIADDYVTRVEGDGVDAELMREYFAAWGERDAYAVSHVGWGLNPRARWDALAMYDKRDMNGTEQRAFAGNFLYSTGANEVAGRFTQGHFDLPFRHCTIRLDGQGGGRGTASWWTRDRPWSSCTASAADAPRGTPSWRFSPDAAIGPWRGTRPAMAMRRRWSPMTWRTSPELSRP